MNFIWVHKFLLGPRVLNWHGAVFAGSIFKIHRRRAVLEKTLREFYKKWVGWSRRRIEEGWRGTEWAVVGVFRHRIGMRSMEWGNFCLPRCAFWKEGTLSFFLFMSFNLKKKENCVYFFYIFGGVFNQNYSSVLIIYINYCPFFRTLRVESALSFRALFHSTYLMY